MYEDWKRKKEIGSGGQAEVFLVSRKGDSTNYALKRFKNAQRLKRSENEILIMKSLWALGLNVPEIIEDGEYAKDRPYYVTKYYVNKSLRSAIEADLPVIRTVDFLLSLCRAIRDINSVGYAHRDLKPENILFDTDFKPILCDYGLGHNLEDGESITPGGEPIGSVHYIHPDAFDIKKIPREKQSALDGYSFGKIAYELIGYEQIRGFNKSSLGNMKVKSFFNDTYKEERFIRSVNRLLERDINVVFDYWSKFPNELESIFKSDTTMRNLSEQMKNRIQKKVVKTLQESAESSSTTDVEYKNCAKNISDSIITNPAIILSNQLFAEQGDSRKIAINTDANLREILEGVGVKSNYGIEQLSAVGWKKSLILNEIYIESPFDGLGIGISIVKNVPNLVVLLCEIHKENGFIDIVDNVSKFKFKPSEEELADLLGSINVRINEILGG